MLSSFPSESRHLELSPLAHFLFWERENGKASRERSLSAPPLVTMRDKRRYQNVTFAVILLRIYSLNF